MSIELIYGAHMRLLARYGMRAYYQGRAATARSLRPRGRCLRRALKHQALGLIEHDRILHGRDMSGNRWPTYVLHPGWVTSKNDRDRHFITARMLIGLYGVAPSRCRVASQRQQPEPGCVHLYPRYDGNYSLPA